jgi:iron complex outermembrane receptor protein
VEADRPPVGQAAGSYENSNPKDSSLIIPKLGRNKRISDRPDLFVGKLASYNATVDYQFDGARFTSSSTYSKFDQKFYRRPGRHLRRRDRLRARRRRLPEDLRRGGAPGVGPGRQVRLGGRRLLSRSPPGRGLLLPVLAAYLAAHGITGLPDEYYQRQYTHINSHELAGFGELTYHFNDKVWLTGGMRYGGVDAQGFTEGGYNSAYLTYAIFGISGPLTDDDDPGRAGVKAEGHQAVLQGQPVVQAVVDPDDLRHGVDRLPHPGGQRLRGAGQRGQSQRPDHPLRRLVGRPDQLRGRRQGPVVLTASSAPTWRPT